MGFTVGMAFVFVSILYSIGLNVLYFSKKHVKNYETKLFGVFLPTNLWIIFGISLYDFYGCFGY